MNAQCCLGTLEQIKYWHGIVDEIDNLLKQTNGGMIRSLPLGALGGLGLEPTPGGS